MKLSLIRSTDIITGSEIFRVASLFLYITLLLQVVLAAATQHLALSDTTGIAIGFLGLLFCASLVRNFWPHVVATGPAWILWELAIALSVIVTLTLQRSIPNLPLPWLIGVAGIFPLVLDGSIALLATVIVAVIGFGVHQRLGMQLGEWLPHMYSTLFAGLLAILLSRALNTNLSAIQQAHMNDRRFDAIARVTRHAFMITDAQYKVKYVNPALQEVIGFTKEEIENLQPMIHPDDVEAHREKLAYLRDTVRGRIFSRNRARHKNGSWVWLETSGYNMLHDAAINGLVFSIEDVTARNNAERKLEEEHALLRAVLDHNPSMIYATDTEGRFTISNQSFQQRLGYSSEDQLRGKTAYEVYMAQATEEEEKQEIHRIADALHVQDMQVIQNGVPIEELEVQGTLKNDMHSWYRINKYPLRDASSRIIGVLGIARDITDSKEYEMRLEHQALHDPLTGLPNRRYLLNTIADAIVESREKPVKLALLFCDLDFFKSVNDTHGHDFGDKCLLEVTKRILAELPTQDFVARFGGNEFIVLTNTTLLETSIKAKALLRVVSVPLVVDDVVVKIQMSIGVALLDANHKNPSELVRDADAAMYQAKERGRNRVEIFDASLQNSTTKRAQMDVALRFALERNELALVYQPKVSMLDGSLKGFELLLRWNSPEYGHISPNEFIPIAETSGLVVPIGLWVLEEACKQIGQWQAKYPWVDGLTISVNVSMRQLLQPSFLAEVTDILKHSRILPYSIELELTETSAMANPLQTIETLSMLKKLGLRLALDDFGTGYSSLAYLQKLPIDVLKIDKAFVHGLGRNSSDGEIVRLILALAQTLNLETVAEGVETQEHVVELRKMGCYLGQGYMFSPAICAEEAEQLVCSARSFAIA